MLMIPLGTCQGTHAEVNPESWANNFDLMRCWWNRGFGAKKVCFENRILKKWWLLLRQQSLFVI